MPAVPRLSPRCFGEPTSRERSWRILYDPNKLRWNCMYSFEELTKILLCSPNAPLNTSPCLFFWGKPTTSKTYHGESTTLCNSAKTFLASYTEKRPSKNYFDLASNPEYVCRAETIDGALMTLTTNTRIWRLGLIYLFASYCWLWAVKFLNAFHSSHSPPAPKNQEQEEEKAHAGQGDAVHPWLPCAPEQCH